MLIARQAGLWLRRLINMLILDACVFSLLSFPVLITGLMNNGENPVFRGVAETTALE